MDCCESENTNDNPDQSKAGKTNINMKELVVWGIIAVLGIAVIYTLFFQGSTGTVVAAGETAGQVASSGMVGGC